MKLLSEMDNPNSAVDAYVNNLTLLLARKSANLAAFQVGIALASLACTLRLSDLVVDWPLLPSVYPQTILAEAVVAKVAVAWMTAS
jgi:hypothetical protein